MKDILKIATNTAKEAGDFLLQNFGKIKKIHTKGDRNFATNLDREAEKIIVDKIKANFPDHSILAEEGGGSGPASDYIWIIDPLDGTHNFMRNINIFGVSIGVMHKKDFIAGVIYMPLEGEVYNAEKGCGAYKNNKRIKVSSTDKLKNCSISFDSSIRYAPKVMLTTLGELAHSVFNVRMFGSSVRHLSYLAEGNLDFCVEFFDKPWDFAGGVCIIKEAGGKITDLEGKPVTHNTTGYIASNTVIHKVLQAVVTKNMDKAKYKMSDVKY